MADAISIEQTESFQGMYDFFNEELFESELPACLLNFSRKSKAYGFFAPERWTSGDGNESAHEISLNPSFLSVRDPKDIASTLVHEMAHLWQMEFGKPSRSGYHNKQWASKMEAIGLTPSNTGASGGKRTGQHMSHYIEDDGPFSEAFENMPKDLWFPWVCIDEEGRSGRAAGGKGGKGASKKKLKVKYSCPDCKTNVWGKGGLELACVPCNSYFDEQ